MSNAGTGTSSVAYVTQDSRQITVPIGDWNVGYQVGLTANSGGAAGDKIVLCAMSINSATTADDPMLVAYVQWYNVGMAGGTVSRNNFRTLAAQTIFYMLYSSPSGIQILAGRNGNDLLYAEFGLL
jgi:hypothetical protein